MNILITAIGSFAAKEVVTSLKKNSAIFNGRLFGCDIYPKEWHNITKEFDEVFLSPKVSNNTDYRDFILNIIKLYNIGLIIPLTDVEVDFFNKFRTDFSKIKLMIGSSNFLKIARDKSQLNIFLIENNYPSIPTYIKDNLIDASFPILAKPKDGRSSEGLHIINNITTLNDKTINYDNYIFQEIFEGDIITVDIVRSSKYRQIVAITRKELLRTKNGAGMTVELFFDEKLSNVIKEIAEKIDLTGCANMEFIKNKNDYYLIDINPRFSAGIGFTSLYGYDIVKNSLLELLGKEIELFNRRDSIIAEKVMSELVNQL